MENHSYNPKELIAAALDERVKAYSMGTLLANALNVFSVVAVTSWNVHWNRIFPFTFPKVEASDPDLSKLYELERPEEFEFQVPENIGQAISQLIVAAEVIKGIDFSDAEVYKNVNHAILRATYALRYLQQSRHEDDTKNGLLSTLEACCVTTGQVYPFQIRKDFHNNKVLDWLFDEQAEVDKKVIVVIGDSVAGGIGGERYDYGPAVRIDEYLKDDYKVIDLSIAGCTIDRLVEDQWPSLELLVSSGLVAGVVCHIGGNDSLQPNSPDEELVAATGIESDPYELLRIQAQGLLVKLSDLDLPTVICKVFGSSQAANLLNEEYAQATRRSIFLTLVDYGKLDTPDAVHPQNYDPVIAAFCFGLQELFMDLQTRDIFSSLPEEISSWDPSKIIPNDDRVPTVVPNTLYALEGFHLQLPKVPREQAVAVSDLLLQQLGRLSDVNLTLPTILKRSK